MPGLNGTTTEKYLVFPERKTSNNQSWIFIVDGTAMIAHEPRKVVSIRNTKVQLTGAMGAIFHR
tara:strand:+ start:290 stop:481 length:192 start_codon:yes stop_codon:yes gene_type:complete